MLNFHTVSCASKSVWLTCALLAASAAPAGAVVINFDTLPSGTEVTTQYQPQGAVFSSNSNGAARIFADVAEATSQPNILIGRNVLSNIFLRFVDPITGSPATASNVSVYAISVGASEWTVTAKNAGGQPIQTFVLQHPDGPVNGLGNQDLLTFAASNIASIDFVFTNMNSNDGIGIDDLSFTLQPVPEPSVAVLMSLGLALMGYRVGSAHLARSKRAVAAEA
jgi:hypothetical protein